MCTEIDTMITTVLFFLILRYSKIKINIVNDSSRCFISVKIGIICFGWENRTLLYLKNTFRTNILEKYPNTYYITWNDIIVVCLYLLKRYKFTDRLGLMAALIILVLSLEPFRAVDHMQTFQEDTTQEYSTGTEKAPITITIPSSVLLPKDRSIMP